MHYNCKTQNSECIIPSALDLILIYEHTWDAFKCLRILPSKLAMGSNSAAATGGLGISCDPALPLVRIDGRPAFQTHF